MRIHKIPNSSLKIHFQRITQFIELELVRLTVKFCCNFRSKLVKWVKPAA